MTTLRTWLLLSPIALVGCNASDAPPPTAPPPSTAAAAPAAVTATARPGGPTVGRPSTVGAPAPPAVAPGGTCPFWGEECQRCVGEKCLKDNHACTADVPCSDARRAASTCLCDAQKAGASTSACMATWGGAGATAATVTACLGASCAAACGLR